MKDGRTHLAYKAEHAVDLESGAVVALTVQPGDRGDTTTMRSTLAEAGRAVTSLAGCKAQPEAVGPSAAVSEVGVERVVADKRGTTVPGDVRCFTIPCHGTPGGRYQHEAERIQDSRPIASSLSQASGLQ